MSINLVAQQKKVYPSQLLETTLEVSSRAKVKTFEVEGSQADSNEFQYMVTITKSIDDEITFEDFRGDEYKNSYLEECNCSIEGEQVQEYENFKSYQLNTITNAQGQTLYGYVDNVKKGDNIYAFVYLTTIDNYEKYKQDYTDVLSSVKFR